VNAERLRLIGAPAKADAAATSATSAAATTQVTSCVEVGEFTAQTVGAFEQQLAKLGVGFNPQRRVVQAAASQLIFIPPLPSEELANRRLAQLRAMGFGDSAVIRDEPTRRWGISLGRFTRAELAEAHLEKLRAAGVNDAQTGEYPVNATRYAVQVTVEEAELRERLKALASKSGGATLRACH
jgi:cell division septation protein DedD